MGGGPSSLVAQSVCLSYEMIKAPVCLLHALYMYICSHMIPTLTINHLQLIHRNVLHPGVLPRYRIVQAVLSGQTSVQRKVA